MLRKLLLGDTQYSQSRTSGTVAGVQTQNETMPNMVMGTIVIKDLGGLVLAASTEFKIYLQVSGSFMKYASIFCDNRIDIIFADKEQRTGC